jgi:hypothetical protein
MRYLRTMTKKKKKKKSMNKPSFLDFLLVAEISMQMEMSGAIKLETLATSCASLASSPPPTSSRHPSPPATQAEEEKHAPRFLSPLKLCLVLHEDY